LTSPTGCATIPGVTDTAAETGLATVLLRPVRDANAFEATVEQLATAIHLGVFDPGDRLPPERELAAAMRVSRSTLREAIAALREAGLVQTRSGRGGGTDIADAAGSAGPADRQNRRRRAREAVALDPLRFGDALVMRRVVEPGAAFTAAGSDLTPDQRQWLRHALDDVSTARDPLLHRRADSRFHLAIAKLTGSQRLLDAVADVQRDLHEMLTAIPVLAVNIVHSNNEHAQIAQAILDGDADRARRVMETHCDGSAALLRGLLGMHERSIREDGDLP
jgi:GntR family transcriptional regulator, transcriptional repressor for pyruvate dehydrogenase complex